LQLRRPINQWLGKIGLRMVNSQWGPVGFIRALQSAKAQGFEPQQIMDIGASNGSWTRECMTVFPEADYFLVEPREAQQAALKTLTDEHPNVAFWTGALGQEAGQLTLLDHGDQSSFLNSEFGDSTGRTTEVQSLDSLLVNKRIPFPNLIKADVQGF
jgi:FkbM family methyltransferase